LFNDLPCCSVLTGLPLIFHHEIDELLGYAPRPETARDGEKKSTVDRIAGAALANDPGKVLQYIAWDKDDPGMVIAYTNGAADGNPTTPSSRPSAPTRLDRWVRSARARCW